MIKAITAALLLSLSMVAFAQPSPEQIAEWKAAADKGEAYAQYFMGVFATIPAYSGTNEKGEAPSLTVRCKNGKTQLYVSWGTFVNNESQSVTDRIDDLQPERGAWRISSNREGLFRPINKQFIRRLMAAKNYVVRTTPYSENPITAQFDMSQFSPVGEKVIEACVVIEY